MKKWILIGGGVIILIVIAGIFLLATNLGPLIKTGVNTYGPDITKTDVRLGDVKVSIFSAKAEIKDFFLGNPKGFNSPHAMKVGSIYVDIDEKSLTGDPIIIDRIEVAAPDISYEKTGRSDNFKTILNNVNKSVGADKRAAGNKPGENQAGKKLMIRDFVVKDGRVNLSMAMLAGQTITAILPDIHLKDIGKKNGGVTPAEAFDEVFKVLYAQITSPNVTDSLDQSLKAVGKSFDAITKEPVKGRVESQKELQSAGKDAEKEVKSITDTVKGLFGN